MVSEIKTVFAQLTPDRVVEGFYKFDGEIITMMGNDGEGNWIPMVLDDEVVSHKATPEHAVSIAAMLTKRIRKALRNELVEGFHRPLEYSNQGIV